MSPMDSVATTVNVMPEDSVSVYSPTNTFGNNSSGGYTRDVKMFSPTASTFAQSGGYSRDVKPISPTNEYAPATSDHFRTSKDPNNYMTMAYTPVPGNPQFIPAPPPAEPSTTVGTLRQNPQLYPEPGPTDENQSLLLKSQNRLSQQPQYDGARIPPVTGTVPVVGAVRNITAEQR